MKCKKLTIALFVLLMLTTVLGMGAYACTSVPVGKDASIDGSVMTTHTCDGWYDARLLVVPGQSFEPGAMTPIYKNNMYFDQTKQGAR
jgi:dipeptidase